MVMGALAAGLAADESTHASSLVTSSGGALRDASQPPTSSVGAESG